MKKSENKPVCGIDYAFKKIGSKHKGRILWLLHSEEVCRYGELRRALPDVSAKMLTQSLKELEQHQLVIRKAYNQVPPKVEYSLDEMGKELIPFIEMLGTWGQKHLENENEEIISCS